MEHRRHRSMKSSLNIDEDIAVPLQKALTNGGFFKRCATRSNLDFRWDYVQANDVQLWDEYDQIYHDLEPFWGMEPRELIALHAEQKLQPDSYTLGKNEEGKLEILRTVFREDTHDGLRRHAQMILKYLRDYILHSVQHSLPMMAQIFWQIMLSKVRFWRQPVQTPVSYAIY